VFREHRKGKKGRPRSSYYGTKKKNSQHNVLLQGSREREPEGAQKIRTKKQGEPEEKKVEKKPARESI